MGSMLAGAAAWRSALSAMHHGQAHSDRSCWRLLGGNNVEPIPYGNSHASGRRRPRRRRLRAGGPTRSTGDWMAGWKLRWWRRHGRAAAWWLSTMPHQPRGVMGAQTLCLKRRVRYRSVRAWRPCMRCDGRDYRRVVAGGALYRGDHVTRCCRPPGACASL